MDDAVGNNKLLNSFPFSQVSQDDLKIIQQAESQLNQSNQDKVVLIAYDKSIQ